MKTKTIRLFDYKELPPSAQDRALNAWREGFDNYGLEVEMDNKLEELLAEHKITPLTDLKGYPTKYGKLFYSLACCQGDGVMFEGVFDWKKQTVTIKHSGHYCHSYSKTVDLENVDGNESTKGLQDAFEAIYQKICKELERFGYDVIDDMQSEERFIEDCNANEWTFREDGTMENA